MARKKKLTKIEDQALTVYHFWVCRAYSDQKYETAYHRQLHGLFEVLRDVLPHDCREAYEDAMKRLVNDGVIDGQ